MRPIGGEVELKSLNNNVFFTDSGRSSLRLFLKNFQDKKYLIPDFACQIVEQIFRQEKINYDFYHVNTDLSIDIQSVKGKSFDVLYLINYFGIIHDLTDLEIDDKIICEDNVFFFDFDNFHKARNWYAFNSYRKISELADGSLVKTNLDINKKLINRDTAYFSQIKYSAKDIKYRYLYQQHGCELDYINKFNEAENLLDKQNEIFQISNFSIYLLAKHHLSEEQTIRKRRFKQLYELFSEFCINTDPYYYSFFVMNIKDRDYVRKKLFEENIFLPIHWPGAGEVNILYQTLISVPLFENYTDDEYEYIINNIKKLYALLKYFT
jgi:hypothetical protein